MEPEFQQRLEKLERGNRRLKRMMAVQAALALATVCCIALATTTQPAPSRPGTLRVKELVVVDPQGVERVRIGGDLPDAVIDGKRMPRGSKAAGVMLYDKTGQERGGYVTWDTGDNIGLTLDSRKGQAALFVADPEGATALQMWHGNDLIEMRSDQNGSRLTRTQSGAVTWQQPTIANIGAATCSEFRNGLRSEVPQGLAPEIIRGICSKHFTTEACDACLGHSE